jgi:type IX secretion system PorP/SprF family membrane protein
MRHCWSIIVVSLLFSGPLSAQDIHFSQLHNTPLWLNPATAGSFTGDHRAFINYRDQWRAIDVKYQTMSASFDMMLSQRRDGGGLGSGIFIFNDRSSAGTLGQTQANLSLAYHVPLSENHSLSAGLQAGYAQRRLSLSGHTWDSQFNGIAFDPTLSGENGELSSGAADFSSGVLWNGRFGESTISSGVSAFHVNTPSFSLLDGHPHPLAIRYSAHAKANIPVGNNNLSFQPALTAFVQNGHRQLIFGNMFRYKMKEASQYTGYVQESSYGLGVYCRAGDAVVAVAQYEVSQMLFSVSYDFNVSPLLAATSGRGGVELSIRFLTTGLSRKEPQSPRFN